MCVENALPFLLKSDCILHLFFFWNSFLGTTWRKNYEKTLKWVAGFHLEFIFFF